MPMARFSPPIVIISRASFSVPPECSTSQVKPVALLTAEGLTALRALRWMDDYGKGDDLNELLSRWVMALANAENSRFAQEIDPLTGEPAQVSQWYSSAMLLFLHGVKRLGLA